MGTKLVKVPSETYEKAVQLSQERNITIGGALELLVNAGAVPSGQVETIHSEKAPNSVLVSVEDHKLPDSRTPAINVGDVREMLMQSYLHGRSDQEQDTRIEALEQELEDMREMSEKVQQAVSVVGQGLFSHVKQHSDVEQGIKKKIDSQIDIQAMLDALDPKFHKGFLEKLSSNVKVVLSGGQPVENAEPPTLEVTDKPKRRGMFG
jgi:hypothetical protein